MFSSHLDVPHHALLRAPMSTGRAPAGDEGLSGLGDSPATSSQAIPAPLAGSSTLMKVAVIGGVALIVFLILKAMTKKT